MLKLSNFIDGSKLYFHDLLSGLEKPWDALQNIEEFINEYGPKLTGFKKIADGIYLGKGVELDSTGKIQGPALIGKNTKLGPATLLRKGVIIGDDCNIGHGSEVKHSIVGSNTNAGHFVYIGDSIVGNKVNLAAGAVLANYKSGASNLEVMVEIDGSKIGTGLEKFGAIVGDYVNLGCNVVTDPGTVIGRNSLIYPLASVHGSIPSNKIVKYKPQLEIVEKK